MRLARRLGFAIVAGLLVTLAPGAAAHPGRVGKDGCHRVQRAYRYQDGRVLPQGDRHCHRPVGELRMDEDRFEDDAAPSAPTPPARKAPKRPELPPRG